MKVGAGGTAVMFKITGLARLFALGPVHCRVGRRLQAGSDQARFEC